jgi:hypothetical protein
VAYADFVTAMMAFFLLMWLLGATTEKQRKGIADYFTPTMLKIRQGGAARTGCWAAPRWSMLTRCRIAPARPATAR